MLKAIDQKDYARFSIHFDEEMKKIINENAFSGLYNLISSRAGQYVSKELVSSSRGEGYAVVQYKARYSIADTEIKIKIVFKETGNSVYVSGFWIDSPVFAQ
jgi:hypothetical protein